jgi:hypothetical protein
MARAAIGSLATLVALSSCGPRAPYVPRAPAAPPPSAPQPSSSRAMDDTTITVSEEVTVSASPEAVIAALTDVRTYRKIFPRVRHARFLGLSHEGDKLVEFEQGTSLFHARFTARMRVENEAAVRLWVDLAYAHNIDDAHVLFSLTPAPDGRTQLAFHALIDLGDDPWKALLRERVRAACRATPHLVARYFEQGDGRGQ